MMARLAALLVLASLAILLWSTFTMTGYSAIVFSFVGHPLLGMGMILGFVALARRLRSEKARSVR